MKIKDYLAQKKKSQSDFAQELGCSNGALSLWISGQRTPSPAMARKVVNHTAGEVSYADLYGNEQSARITNSHQPAQEPV